METCRALVAAVAVAAAMEGCAVWHPRAGPARPAISRSRIARCDHWQLDAAAALATPPDPATGLNLTLGAYGIAMAQYRACLIGH